MASRGSGIGVEGRIDTPTDSRFKSSKRSSPCARSTLPKIREKLIRSFPMIPTPAKSTVHAVLDRHGLVEPRKRRRHKAEGTPLSRTSSPNGLWCADFKGEFMLGNRRYCYPLTVSELQLPIFARLRRLGVDATTFAFAVFERVFQEYGLPQAIRTDNGVPFASPMRSSV